MTNSPEFAKELQIVNSIRYTLGIYLLCQPQRGIFIVPICIEAASWISLFSQNSAIEFSYPLTVNQKEERFSLGSKSAQIQ